MSIYNRWCRLYLSLSYSAILDFFPSTYFQERVREGEIHQTAWLLKINGYFMEQIIMTEKDSAELFDDFIGYLKSKKMWEVLCKAQEIKHEILREDYKDFVNNN